MSRTHAHRPRWVWLNDRPDLVREHHNHDNGVCDLPLAPFTDVNNYGFGKSCWVDLDWSVQTCSCDLCSGHSHHRLVRRQARAAVRTLLLAAAGGIADAQLEAMQARVHQIETGRMW